MRGVLLLVLVALATPAFARAKRDDRKRDDRKVDTRRDDDKKADDKKADAKKADAKQPDPPPPAPPRTPGPDDAKVKAVLDKIVAGPDTAARKAAIAELSKLAPGTIDAIAEWLARPHQTDVEERRKVLVEIKASIPDKKGTFSQPPRQTGKERQADDDLDWLTALLALDVAAMAPALGEVIGDVAAIRALAGTQDVRATQLIFDAAFAESTMIYRDECGRYMRKMEPFCIPALTRQAQKGDYDHRRYATFQLERIDRQDPLKALAAASGNEAVMIAVLDVFRETKLREAVHAVWTKINDDSPRVRAAARAAWMDYLTGPEPPAAPRKKLQLPGGKLTKKPKPLWLTYRELADTELRKAANELLHEDYVLDDETQLDDRVREVKIEKIDLIEVTGRLFEYFDAERIKQDGTQWLAAKAKADAGDLAAAAAMLDRLIATNAERAERAEMAKIYASWGKTLEAKQAWGDASAAYSKAHGLDPKGAAATDVLAAHHFALGKALEAQGKDGGPDFRRAVALKPDYAPAKTAADRAESTGRPVWMLYAAGLAMAVAAALFAAAMLKRRTT